MKTSHFLSLVIFLCAFGSLSQQNGVLGRKNKLSFTYMPTKNSIWTDGKEIIMIKNGEIKTKSNLYQNVYNLSYTRIHKKVGFGVNFAYSRTYIFADNQYINSFELDSVEYHSIQNPVFRYYIFGAKMLFVGPNNDISVGFNQEIGANFTRCHLINYDYKGYIGMEKVLTSIPTIDPEIKPMNGLEFFYGANYSILLTKNLGLSLNFRWKYVATFGKISRRNGYDKKLLKNGYEGENYYFDERSTQNELFKQNKAQFLQIGLSIDYYF